MKESYSRVSIVGLGYIGLPTAAVLASHGVEVVGVDIKPEAVDTINDGKTHIIEPNLDALIHDVVSNGRLRATLVPEEAQAFVIAVPTPFKDGEGPDISYVKKAAESIAPLLRKGNLVILESTSPVGTTERLTRWMSGMRPDLTFPGDGVDNPDVCVAYCPERVLPGNVLRELECNDRIIGGMSASCSVRAAELYRIFVKGELVITNSRTAEMTKLTENAFRDVNIAFANELSLVCERLGINVWELIRLTNHHPRVNILQPGPGVGGHCIAVDPKFIVHAVGDDARLMKLSREINDGKPEYVFGKIDKIAQSLENPVIACLGLSYKADIDDLRESPAITIVSLLSENRTGRILVVEPHIDGLPASLRGADGVEFSGLESALKQADIIVFLVGHSVFRNIDSSLLKDKLIVDTVGLRN